MVEGVCFGVALHLLERGSIATKQYQSIIVATEEPDGDHNLNTKINAQHSKWNKAMSINFEFKIF